MSEQEMWDTLEKARDELHDAMACIDRGDLRGAMVRAEAAQYLAGDVVSAIDAAPTPALERES